MAYSIAEAFIANKKIKWLIAIQTDDIKVTLPNE